MSVIRKVQVRRGTAAAWSSANPVLSLGEFGYDTTNGKVKIGDGSTAWNSLAFAAYTPAEVNALIADFQTSEDVQSVLENNIAAGEGISLSYDSGTGVLTISQGGEVGEIRSPSGVLIGEGNARVAANFIQSARRVLVLSDSTWTRELEYTRRPFYGSERITKIKILDSAGGLGGTRRIWGTASALTSFGYTVQNYSPYASAYEYPMPASYPDVSFWAGNRVAQYPFTFPQTGAGGVASIINPTADTFSGSLPTLSKTRGFRCTFEYLAGPHGDPNANLKLHVTRGLTVIAESAAFSTYNATEEIRTVTVDVPSWSGSETSLNAVVRGVNLAATTTGRYLVALSCSFALLDNAANDLCIEAISFGGETVATYLDTSRLSNNAWARINAANYDAVVLALGINGYGTPSVAQWKTDYQTLIDKIRGTNSNLPIVSIDEGRMSTTTGMSTSIREILADNSNMLFISTSALMPAHSILYQNFTPAWQTGTYYRLGDLVTYAGKVYVHKVLYPGLSSTAPDLDSTNWVEITQTIDSDVFHVGMNRNYTYADAIHPTVHGRRLMASQFWLALELASQRIY